MFELIYAQNSEIERNLDNFIVVTKFSKWNVLLQLMIYVNVMNIN